MREDEGISERNRMEKALKKSEEEYRLLFDNMGMSLFLLKVKTSDRGEPVDYIFAKTNNYFNRIPGIDKKEVIGKTTKEVFSSLEGYIEEYYKGWEKSLRKVALTGEQVQFERYSPFQKRWFSVTIYRPKMGHVAVLLGNITEKKKAQKAVEEEKNLTESIINSLPGVFYVFNDEQRLVKWNKNTEKILELSPEEMSKIHLLDGVEGEDKIRLMEASSKTLTEGRSEVEVSLVSKSGKRTPFLFSAVTMNNNDKTYIIGTGFNIAEKRKAKEALEKSEEEYRLLFDNMQKPFALLEFKTDEKGKPTDYIFVKVNHSFEKLSGLNKKDIINKTSKELFAHLEEDYLNWEKKFRKTALTGEQIQFEKYSPFHKTWISITSYRPKVGHIAILFEDITKKKKTQEDEINKLKELDEAKINFLNIISHELKTPLTAIFAHLDVLDDLKPQHSDESLESLDAIKRNSKHLKVLIENILETSRIESKKLELNLEKIDISHLIEKLVGNLKILSDKKQLELTTEIEELPKIVADHERIEGVLYNLIHNAIKFTNEGFVKVIAKKQGENVLVQIKDTGVGMSDGEMEKLFQKFYQIDPSISRKHGGTGIGLSISKQLIELHEGEISVKSKPGEGSTFSFLLPIKQKEVKE